MFETRIRRVRPIRPMRRIRRVWPLIASAAALLAAAPALARPASADRDGRPNVLVVMTDDMATADLEHLPNVQRLLAEQGTTFADAVD